MAGHRAETAPDPPSAHAPAAAPGIRMRRRARDRVRGVAGRHAASRVRGGARRRDERGGAVSLWVVLMVPVSAFAAVVAMAGPQRLAAESSVQEAADDLAMFTVAWRDGHQMPEGPLPAFPPECAARTEQQQTDLAALGGQISGLSPTDPNIDALIVTQEGELNRLLSEFGMPPPLIPAADVRELRTRFDELLDALDALDAVCDALFEALVRDLGYLGVDTGSLRGSYSDSLETAGTCSDPQFPTEARCTGASETWIPHSRFPLPCWTAAAEPGTPGRAAVVARDAVHVALAADWQGAGWAAAQVWPDGLPMAAESMGRLSQYDHAATPPPECADHLVVFDSEGRPVWAGGDPSPDSRELAQSLRRSTLSG